MTRRELITRERDAARSALRNKRAIRLLAPGQVRAIRRLAGCDIERECEAMRQRGVDPDGEHTTVEDLLGPAS